MMLQAMTGLHWSYLNCGESLAASLPCSPLARTWLTIYNNQSAQLPWCGLAGWDWPGRPILQIKTSGWLARDGQYIAGRLVNQSVGTEDCAVWTFGVGI